MNSIATLARTAAPAKRVSVSKCTVQVACLATAIFLAALPTPAHALDGCKVLLCLAAPSWRAIPACVPDIKQLYRDLAKGKVFPTCALAGAGNSSHHTWASAPANCPAQYTQVIESESSTSYVCDYAGAVTVSINNTPFTRTWWSMGGDTVTEFTAAAKLQLGTWDSQFDDDHARWLASLPPPAPPPSCGDC